MKINSRFGKKYNYLGYFLFEFNGMFDKCVKLNRFNSLYI